MDNHFHLILRAPEETPGEAETLRRYKEFHRGRRELVPGTFAGRFARYVAGGLAIGSEAFVRGVMRTIFGEERVLNRELPVVLDEDDELFAWSCPRAPAG